MNNVEIYHNYSIKKIYGKIYRVFHLVFKELFIYCIFVYFIFKSFTKINSYKTETFEKKNIQIYSIKEVLWVSSKRFSIFICIFFQIKNKRIYGVFSLLGISAKGLDIFLKKNIQR